MKSNEVMVRFYIDCKYQYNRIFREDDTLMHDIVGNWEAQSDKHTVKTV